MFILGKRQRVKEGAHLDATMQQRPGEALYVGDDNRLRASSGALTTSYLMESVDEGERLERKTDPIAVGEQLLMTGLRLGMRGLDVACGTGAVTRVMAKIAGPGRITGLDMSAERLTSARLFAQREHVDVTFAQGTADALPFPSASFDYTHARFLFEYLPKHGEVLGEMIRVTRPGGYVVVADLDGQIDGLYPMDEGLRQDVDDALSLLSAHGFDPRVGRKLYTLFTAAGLRQLKVRVVPYQVYSGGLPEGDIWNWRAKLTTSARFLAQQTGDVERWARFQGNYLAHLTARDAFYHSSLILMQGRVPGQRTAS